MAAPDADPGDADAPSAEPRRSAVRAWWIPLVVVVLGALVLGIAWWNDAKDRVEVGIVETTADVNGAERFTDSFQVPSGSVNVTLSVATDNLSESIQPPRGGRLVRVTWDGHANLVTPGDTPEGEWPGVSLWLRSGEHRWRLTDEVEMFSSRTTVSDDDPSRARVVGVPGTTRDLVIEAQFAGRRQSVEVATGERTTGSFASLYRPRPTAATISGEPNGTRVEHGARWWSRSDARWQRRPYVNGRGWAAPGKEWLLVTVTVRSDDFDVKRPGGDEIDSYQPDPSSARGALTVDHGRPLEAPSTRVVGSADGVMFAPGQVVFEVPDGSALTARVKMTVPLRPAPYETDAPKRPDPLVFSQTFDIPAVLEAGSSR